MKIYPSLIYGGCVRSHDYCIIKALINSTEGLIDEGIVFSGQNVYKIKDILPVDTIFAKILAEYDKAQ